MNYYGPRELLDENGKGKGVWHYTCQSDGAVWPVGYCSPWETCPDCKEEKIPKTMGGPDCPTCDGKRLVRKADPCPGHATADLACEHQRQYDLDHARYYRESELQQKPDTLHRCEAPGCEEYTAGCASWGPGHMRLVSLCDKHCDRETLEQMVRVGESVSSY